MVEDGIHMVEYIYNRMYILWRVYTVESIYIVEDTHMVEDIYTIRSFRPLLCKMLGMSEIGYKLLKVSIGLKTPDYGVDWNENFSNLIIFNNFSLYRQISCRPLP